MNSWARSGLTTSRWPGGVSLIGGGAALMMMVRFATTICGRIAGVICGAIFANFGGVRGASEGPRSLFEGTVMVG